MERLSTLEALILDEKAALHGREMNKLDPLVVGATIGTLYAIILGNKEATNTLETIINRKRKAMFERNQNA